MSLTGTDAGSSKLSTFLTCHQKYYLAYLHGGQGLIQVEEKYALEFGNAIHEALNWFYKGLVTNREPLIADLGHNVAQAIKVGVDYIESRAFVDPEKSLLIEEVISGLDQYFQKYESEIIGTEDGLVPLEVERDVSAQVGPYKRTGRIDLLGTYKGFRCIPDHKTTGKDWNRFFKKWRLDLSLRGYVYMYWKETGELLNVLINGIRRRKTKDFQVEFQRDLICYTKRDMEWFERIVMSTCHDIGARDPNNQMDWEQNGAACVTDYDCEMRPICTHPESEELRFRRKVEDVSTPPVA